MEDEDEEDYRTDCRGIKESRKQRREKINKGMNQYILSMIELMEKLGWEDEGYVNGGLEEEERVEDGEQISEEEEAEIERRKKLEEGLKEEIDQDEVSGDKVRKEVHEYLQ